MKTKNLNIMNIAKKFSGALFIGLIGLSLHSCQSDPNSPGLEYMPDMYRSPALEPNMQQADEYAADSQEVRLPAVGSIPRGFMPFTIPIIGSNRHTVTVIIHPPSLFISSPKQNSI